MLNKVLITYATLTGNTQQVAEKMHEHLVAKNIANEVVAEDMNNLSPEQLTEYDLVLLGSSTWNDGTYNPTSETFFTNFDQSEVDLSNVKFAIFGLGESFYPDFCTVVDTMDASVKSKNGQVVAEHLKIDGMPNDEIFAQSTAWIDSFSENLG